MALSSLERHKLQCAGRQFYIVAGMCAGRELPRQLTRQEQARSDAAMWRELFVLLGMCGMGW